MRKLAALFMVLTIAVLSTGTGVAGAHGSTGHGATQHTRHVHVIVSGRGHVDISGPTITGKSYGTARISSVGRFIAYGGFVCNADCSSSRNTTVYVAANGDTFTVSGIVGPGPDDNVQEVIGGTGRFAHASGRWIETAGHLDFDPTNPFLFTLKAQFVATLRY